MKRLLLLLLLLLTTASRAAEGASGLPTEVSLSVGESLLLMADVKRAALGSGKVVSIATPEPGQLLLFGEAAGRTTAQLWLRDGSHHVVQVRVTEQDLTARLAQVQGLLVGVGHVSARINGGYVVLEGTHASAEERAHADEVAALFPGQVLNFMGRADWESMVQMQVRLVEVRRDQLRQLGIRWDSDAAGPSASVAAGAGVKGVQVHAALASSLLSRLQLLQQRGLAYTVAEPMLSCRSGGSARFVSGGEVPIPVTDGLGATDVQYKEYGVILEVRPRTDSSGAIYADIDVELSQIDSAVRVGDYPGFLKRRTSTAFNAQGGETIAIAGLVARERGRDRSAVPGLASIPALGGLFQSSRRLEKETELLVLITPRVLEGGVVSESGGSGQPQLIQRADELKAAGSKP